MSLGIVKQTKLWDIAKDRLSPKDILEIEQACNDAEDLLSRVTDTFPTYTLHDARHAKNVCDIMAKLLGEHINIITGLEAAFLMLSAFYHDVGMVYTTDEKESVLKSNAFESFCNKHLSVKNKIALRGRTVPEDLAEWFFRSIHPQRMDRIPEIQVNDIPIKQELMTICKSHGNPVVQLISREYKDLIDFDKESADLVFCAILLRIADLLDFDQTRSPDILYSYLDLKNANSKKYEESKREFIKHRESLGFVFPKTRRGEYKIRFNAICENIEIENDIRGFLDVIQRELRECSQLLLRYTSRLNANIIPISIELKDSYGKNYQYGQYLFTVEQDCSAPSFCTREKVSKGR